MIHVRKPANSLEGPMVLAVDDSLTVTTLIERMLQKEHIRVVTARDGLSALSSIADEAPALILLDIQLAYMNGYHICQIIHKNPQIRYVPVIMLTGKDDVPARMHSRLVGATEHMTKPFDSAELVKKVKKYLINWQAHVPARLEIFSAHP